VSNYTKTTNFAAKDALASGNAGKVVKGSEIDTEFTNIQTAIATKADGTFTNFSFVETSTSCISITHLLLLQKLMLVVI